MSSIIISILVVVCIFAGGLIGLSLNRVLRPSHLTKETQEVVRLGIGMISVLSSLVLGPPFEVYRHETASETAESVMPPGKLDWSGRISKFGDAMLRTRLATWPDSQPNSGMLLDQRRDENRVEQQGARQRLFPQRPHASFAALKARWVVRRSPAIVSRPAAEALRRHASTARATPEHR